ncbi:MAG: NYN domain-containing protein [Gammaproteobacteria bacterium]|nr:NYN domain-containing protein [Gammaproteobacteria bacterium]
MDTIVYIDGYNLFYGRLRNSPYKWINPFKLLQLILNNQDPSFNLIKVKYFTSPVKAKFASHGDEASKAQNAYHRAITFCHNDDVEIVFGYHTVERGTPPKFQSPIDKTDRVDVWNFEEKQTDVNIALHMYRDAIRGHFGQQVLVSNDSDLELALKFIKEETPEITLGLVIPRAKPTANKKGRAVSASLSKHTDWCRKYIFDEECEAAQFPEKIPTKKKPIIKPCYW